MVAFVAGSKLIAFSVMCNMQGVLSWCYSEFYRRGVIAQALETLH